MSTAVGYYLKLLLVRQSALAPAVAFVGLTALLYASPAGPATQAGAVTAIALFPISAWLCRLVSTAESPPYAQVILVALGSRSRRMLARAIAALAASTLLGAVAVGWAVVANRSESYTATTLTALLLLHLSQAVAGVGLGTLLSPPIANRPGPAVVAVTVVAALSLAIPWLPPLQPLLHIANHPSASGVLAVTLQAAVVGAACFLAAALLDRGNPRG